MSFFTLGFFTGLSLILALGAQNIFVIEQGLKSKILNPPWPEYTKLLLSSVPEMDPNWLTNLLSQRK